MKKTGADESVPGRPFSQLTMVMKGKQAWMCIRSSHKDTVQCKLPPSYGKIFTSLRDEWPSHQKDITVRKKIDEEFMLAEACRGLDWSDRCWDL